MMTFSLRRPAPDHPKLVTQQCTKVLPTRPNGPSTYYIANCAGCHSFHEFNRTALDVVGMYRYCPTSLLPLYLVATRSRPAYKKD